MVRCLSPTLKEFDRLAGYRDPTLFRVRGFCGEPGSPRVAKAQPWAEISKRFQRRSKLHEYAAGGFLDIRDVGTYPHNLSNIFTIRGNASIFEGAGVL